MEVEIPMDTVAKLEDKKLLETQSDRLAEMEVEKTD